ncbi:MAG: N-acetylneuraminate synthase family protein, partial [Planctomycetota bacterium]
MKPLQVLSPPKTDASRRRIVRVRNVEIGADRPVVIAGPCAVESYEQTFQIARGVRAAGGDILRGGAFKPRTSPYDFQGLGQEGLEILKAASEETGLPIVTEVMEVGMIELVSQYADMLQIGSRNMQNYPLLRAVGRQPLPVLLKRGMAATLEEWLCAAEYVAVGGNDQIAL